MIFARKENSEKNRKEGKKLLWFYCVWFAKEIKEESNFTEISHISKETKIHDFYNYDKSEDLPFN